MDSDEPIDAVAARTGFSDRYHLSKAFRKHHGQSPAAFPRRLPPPPAGPADEAPKLSPGCGGMRPET